MTGKEQASLQGGQMLSVWWELLMEDETSPALLHGPHRNCLLPCPAKPGPAAPVGAPGPAVLQAAGRAGRPQRQRANGPLSSPAYRSLTTALMRGLTSLILST